MYGAKPSMAELRRRSVDVGGLALALAGSAGDGSSSGAGWGGFQVKDAMDDDESVRYAEMLSDMYVSTHTIVNIANYKQLPTNEKIPGNRQRLIDSLDTWHFEPHKLPEDAVLACTILLFEALLRTENMVQDIGLDMDRVDPFLRHLRGIYRQENSYHNFQHALDVLQATHMFLSAAGVVPPVSMLSHPDGRQWIPDRRGASPLVASLTNTDLFALYIAAIGHDAGHPGFSNVFMKNAQTPLSAVYSDRSALEQMHCALLLQVMRHNGMDKLLDAPKKGPRFRHLLLQTILATDMSVHGQFMSDFASLLAVPSAATSSSLPTPPSDKQKLLVCQALIKCADISNPCRPRGVARHWANALVAEWTAQAALEKALRLPATVNPSAEPIAEAKSQVFFISTFAGPLFNLTTRGIPELSPYSREGASNLEWWRARLDRLVLGHEPATPPTASSALPQDPARDPDEDDTTSTFAGAFPLTLPPMLRISEPEPPMSPLQATFNTISQSPAGMSTFDEVPSSPTMPGAFVSTPPTLTRSLSSPPSSPSSSRTSGSSVGPGRLHIATNLSNVGSGPLPTPPPDGPPNFLTTHPHSHARTNSAASATSAVSSNFSAASAAGTGAADPALRSAMKASMRKKSSQHFHRASWNPTAAAIPSLPPHALLASASSVVSSVTSSPNPSNHSSPVFSTTIFNKTHEQVRSPGKEAVPVGNGSD